MVKKVVIPAIASVRMLTCGGALIGTLLLGVGTAARFGLCTIFVTFVMGIAVAASCSYLTPLEPACVMVYGPGRYKFMDFVRVGAPLSLVILVIALVLVPQVWPMQ